jgi:hypothetical protein
MGFLFFILILAAFVVDLLVKRTIAKHSPLLRLLAFIFVLAAFVFWLRTEWDTNYIADHCEYRIERNCDPLVLQAWAAKLITAPNGFSNGPVRTYRHPYIETNGPIFVDLPRGLYGVWRPENVPYLAIIGAQGGKEGFVDVVWGSGILGHWGLSIGSTTYVPAPVHKKMRLWKPGIYFFRDPE